VLTEHWAAVEADFRQYYGLSLRDSVYGTGTGGGRMGGREICSLLLGLPAESRTMEALGGGWSRGDVLTGLVVERLDQLQAITVRAHGGRPGELPTIVPRPPAAAARRTRARSTEDLLADLEAAGAVA
jgi:hypothetical protein